MELGFFLKKFISFFVEPFGMVLFLFVLGICFLFLKRVRLAKSFLLLAIGMMFLFSYPPFSNLLVKNLEEKYPQYDYKQSVKYIHVLGSGHTTDPDQPLSSQIGGSSLKRVIEGIIIHKQIENSKLIFTGYEGNTNISNAKMNASLALALGVEAENIIVNEAPKDTKEEALFTKTFVGDAPFVLVTSATHMPRSMELFASLGLRPIAAPSDFVKEEFKGFFVAPSVYNFRNSQMAVHEYIGMAWSKLKR